MGLFDDIAELLFPTRCAGCELPGALLCDRCIAALPRVELSGACPRCGAPYGLFVCTECWDREWAFSAGVAFGEFEPPLARAVVLHKDAGERRLAQVLGSMLATQIAAAWPDWPNGVAFVPATRAALRRRGFDHGRAIADAVAHELGVPMLECLTRSRARDQRTLGREARAANVAGTVTATADVSGRILLTDDVFTTGATLDAAAAVLLAAGAQEVRVAAVARTW
ncbi:MAG: ComF family protein [Coriobacteriia bacterium]|nr:ComF family protein [Coriobacteriia bacterium]